jgi:hypothetical protein
MSITIAIGVGAGLIGAAWLAKRWLRTS